jgi:hypothetical protein
LNLTDGFWIESKAAIVSLSIRLKKGTVTIAGKLSVEMPKGTAINILKQAKLR